MSLNAVERVISGVRRPTSEQLTHVGILNQQSLHSLTDGTATNEDWDKLCAALNISIVMIERSGLGAEYLPDIDAAMQALQAVGKRWLTWHKWQITKDEMAAIVTGMDVHDELLRTLGVKTIELAQVEVTRRLRAGKIKYLVKPKIRHITRPDLQVEDAKMEAL